MNLCSKKNEFGGHLIKLHIVDNNSSVSPLNISLVAAVEPEILI